jgi:hypothetical protein
MLIAVFFRWPIALVRLPLVLPVLPPAETVVENPSVEGQVEVTSATEPAGMTSDLPCQACIRAFGAINLWSASARRDASCVASATN